MFDLLLAGGTIPQWYATLYPILKTAFVVLMAICAIAIIVIIMLMESNAEGGNNAITGSNESFYAQNKNSTREGRLKKVIKIASITIAVLTVLYFVLDIIKNAF